MNGNEEKQKPDQMYEAIQRNIKAEQDQYKRWLQCLCLCTDKDAKESEG
ncbi:MAG: hypothetical protein LIO94_02345 [Clostridiales bacterium]|nr:hypothetical protein [Clostridiales bacterium]